LSIQLGKWIREGPAMLVPILESNSGYIIGLFLNLLTLMLIIMKKYILNIL